MAEVHVTGGGTKHDRTDNKCRMELVPPSFVRGVGDILTFGAEKYGADNWMQGIEYRRLIGATKRHLASIEEGEDHDPETGKLHAYHAACNLAFLSYFQEHSAIYGELCDDRVFIKVDVDVTLGFKRISGTQTMLVAGGEEC